MYDMGEVRGEGHPKISVENWERSPWKLIPSYRGITVTQKKKSVQL